MCRMVGHQNSGRHNTLLSSITCCHRAILSSIESSLGLFYSLIILLSKYVLQIKMRICLTSETIKMLAKIEMEDKR